MFCGHFIIPLLRTTTNKLTSHILHYRAATVNNKLPPLVTYALCGFAYFGSIAIQTGGYGSLVPRRREDFARLGLRAMIGGSLAAFMTAAIVAMLI
ncbi:MAG: nucleoside transporter C-terminal domain-containing protein [Planctomycetota bacterium]